MKYSRAKSGKKSKVKNFKEKKVLRSIIFYLYIK